MTMLRFAMPAVFAGIAVFLTTSSASAVTTTTRTIPSGTTFTAVLHKGIDSSTLTTGSNFVLHIDEPTQPAIDRATIHGHVTDVSGPSGVDRAHIGFVFDYIKFQNGSRAPVHVQVLSKYVTQTNTAAVAKEAAKFSLPPMPVGTVTPGPIAWQLTFRHGSSPSYTPAPTGLSGGYVYAANSNENIVIPPGTPVTMQLTSSLTVP